LVGCCIQCLTGDLDTGNVGADTNIGRVGKTGSGVGNGVVRGLQETSNGSDNGVVGGISDNGSGSDMVSSISGNGSGDVVSGISGSGVGTIVIGIRVCGRVVESSIGLGISLTLDNVLNGSVLGNVAGAEYTVGGGSVLLRVVVVGDGVRRSNSSNNRGSGVDNGVDGVVNSGSVVDNRGSGSNRLNKGGRGSNGAYNRGSIVDNGVDGVVNSGVVDSRDSVSNGVVGGHNGGCLLNLGYNGGIGNSVVGVGERGGVGNGASIGVSGSGITIRIAGVEKSGIGFRLCCHEGTKSENYELKIRKTISLSQSIVKCEVK
jgi:hypothetical protein